MNKDEIIEKLNNNEVVGFPTDTVFGLIVKLNKNNIAKLNNIKQRDENTPLQVLSPSLREASKHFVNDYFVMEYLANNYKERTSYIVEANKEFNRKFNEIVLNGLILIICMCVFFQPIRSASAMHWWYLVR